MVSVIIVMRNAENYIINCINSLVKQFDKSEPWELLIIDGLSTDNSREIATAYLQNSDINYRILDNHRKSLAAGWNIGIKESTGEYLLRPDAHAELLDNYISNGISKLKANNMIAAVGGTLISRSQSKIGKLIAVVLSNPIGVGNSLFRIGVSHDAYTNSVVYAIYRKKVLEEVGGLNEELYRNQDIDLHKRIIDKGYKLLTANNMKAIYYNRSTIKNYLIQGFTNGVWITRGKTRHFKHIIPMLFVLSMILICIFSIEFFPILLLIHFFTSFISYIYISHIYNPITLFHLWVLTLLLHTFYGVGSLWGIYKKTQNILICKLNLYD